MNLYKKHLWRLTAWGSVILNKQCFDKMMEYGRGRKYDESPWFLAGWCAEILSTNEDWKFGTIYTKSIEENYPNKKRNSWDRTDRMMKYVYTDYNYLIDVLIPRKYTQNSDKMIIDLRETANSSKISLIRQRMYNIVNFSSIREYEKEIKRVDEYYEFMYRICFIPSIVLRIFAPLYVRYVHWRYDR